MSGRAIAITLPMAAALALFACSAGDTSGASTPPSPVDAAEPSTDAGADRMETAAPEAGADGGQDAASDAGIHFSGTPKIMPFGDSITGSTCWRARLWEKLETNGYKSFKFVGSQDSSGNCGDAKYDGHNEGHPGYLLDTLAGEEPKGEMDGWFSANPPDILLMHFGTNDVWNKIATKTILDDYGVAIDTVRKYAPNVVILVAQIIPMAPSNCPSCAAGVQQLDMGIPAWAAAKSTTSSPIIVVDQWSGFDDSTDTQDGVHPNDTTGSQKVADKWYAALTPML